LNPAKDKNPMTHDLADQILATIVRTLHDAHVPVNAESIHGVNSAPLRRSLHAAATRSNCGRARIGYYDADPAHVVDLDSVSAIEIPATVGHCGVITGMDCL
jgi:hypothetical protein